MGGRFQRMVPTFISVIRFRVRTENHFRQTNEAWTLNENTEASFTTLAARHPHSLLSKAVTTSPDILANRENF